MRLSAESVPFRRSRDYGRESPELLEADPPHHRETKGHHKNDGNQPLRGGQRTEGGFWLGQKVLEAAG